ncbi:MAG: hypothetical protein AAGG11_01210 [Pseudomonadota bacterium]
MSSPIFTLYAMASSGNCDKVEPVAALLGLAVELHEIDVLRGKSRTREVLSSNPNGRVLLRR